MSGRRTWWVAFTLPPLTACVLVTAVSLTATLSPAYMLASVALVIVGIAVAAAVTQRRRRELAALSTRVDAIRFTDGAVHAPAPIACVTPLGRLLCAALTQRLDEIASALEHDVEAHQKVARARDLRSRLMASMGHELRSPLNSILGFAQLLEEGVDGPLLEEQTQSVVIVRRSAQQLLRLTNDILDCAMLEAGRLTLEPDWTPSVEILTEASQEARSIVEGTEVKVQEALQPGLPPVYVDRARVVQAVVGLFRHAALTLSKGTLELRARISQGPPGPAEQVRVEICDPSGSIPPERVERIFEAFREIHRYEGQRIGGLGMALSLARGVGRLHGGEVWCESQHADGITLSIALPVTGPEADEDATGDEPDDDES